MEHRFAAATLPLNIKLMVAHFGDRFQESDQLAHKFGGIFVLSGFKLRIQQKN